jgi:hypothetical protein
MLARQHKTVQFMFAQHKFNYVISETFIVQIPITYPILNQKHLLYIIM